MNVRSMPLRHATSLRFPDRHGRLGSTFSQRRRDDGDLVTVLEGSVIDQAELAGILNTFYELHLSLVSVQRIKEADAGKEP
jgi:hypothetical protein